MKRPLIFAALMAGTFWLFPPAQSRAQDAAAAAAREEAEARYTRMNTKVQDLEETLQAHQERYMALNKEVHNLREDLDRLKNKNESAATQESLKRLAEKIEEVDRKRQEDNKLVLAQLDKLGKTMLARPLVVDKPPQNPTGVRPPAATGNGGAPGAVTPGLAVPENGYEYVIKKNDTLDRIVRDLRAGNIKVSQPQIEAANPGVNWNKLKIGQKIFIPAPPQ